jgi:hypothetical protein
MMRKITDLIAVEETAALQLAIKLCKDAKGSTKCSSSDSVLYFVSEYGEHVDGGVRRDNIWPSIAAIKLTLIKKTPCLVLHYSDIDNVEDYNSGNGLGLLFSSLSHIIDNYVCGRAALDDTEELLARQSQEMLLFIHIMGYVIVLYLLNVCLIKMKRLQSYRSVCFRGRDA